MENYAKTTRFCLICNYVSRIIEPLASRCAKFRFKPLPVDTLTRQLRMICGKESLECDDEALSALVRVSDGDMRKSIMFLQSASRLRRSGQMSAADFYNIAGVSLCLFAFVVCCVYLSVFVACGVCRLLTASQLNCV